MSTPPPSAFRVFIGLGFSGKNKIAGKAEIA